MKGLLTELSVEDIQRNIWRSLGGGSTECIPNVSFGFFKEKSMEADLLQITDYNYLHEYEIKRSKSDFLADFKKPVFHADVRISHLTYVLPDALSGEWLRQWCAEHYKEFKRTFDFWFYDESGNLKRPNYFNEGKYSKDYYLNDEMRNYIDQHDPVFPFRRRLFAEEKSELYRLCMVRYWNKPRIVKPEVKIETKAPAVLEFLK